jgi:hypothetical protein
MDERERRKTRQRPYYALVLGPILLVASAFLIGAGNAGTGVVAVLGVIAGVGVTVIGVVGVRADRRWRQLDE